jgi:hypothetical protein
MGHVQGNNPNHLLAGEFIIIDLGGGQYWGFGTKPRILIR